MILIYPALEINGYVAAAKSCHEKKNEPQAVSTVGYVWAAAETFERFNCVGLKFAQGLFDFN